MIEEQFVLEAGLVPCLLGCIAAGGGSNVNGALLVVFAFAYNVSMCMHCIRNEKHIWSSGTLQF